METRFSCTMCGRCCHDLRVPLSLDEAATWLMRGGVVQILCDAMPWLVEPTESDMALHYRRQRSFAAMSGELPIRVTATLVGAFEGPCPNLLPDLRCGAYDARPRVCRIYPAGINPLVVFDPDNKACPTDAWTKGGMPLLRNGYLSDAGTILLVDEARALAVSETAARAQLCALLDCSAAALVHEGFAVYAPAPQILLAALEQVRGVAGGEEMHDASRTWRLLSNRPGTLDALDKVSAYGMDAAHAAEHLCDYLGFFSSGEAP